MPLTVNVTRLTNDEELAQMETILQSLPLSTDEYSVAMNHLNNARTYFKLGEIGAGLFEAKFVLAKIRQS